MNPQRRNMGGGGQDQDRDKQQQQQDASGRQQGGEDRKPGQDREQQR